MNIYYDILCIYVLHYGYLGLGARVDSISGVCSLVDTGLRGMELLRIGLRVFFYLVDIRVESYGNTRQKIVLSHIVVEQGRAIMTSFWGRICLP